MIRLLCKHLFHFILLWCVSPDSRAQDSIPVMVSSHKLFAKDTLSFYYLGNFKKSIKNPFTIHLWIDHIQSRRRWKFRYPVINSEGGGDLILSDQLPKGNYALNFLFDGRFFELNGNIRDYKSRKKSKILTVDLINNFGVTNMEIQPDKRGGFSMLPTLFQDTSVLMFGYDKNKNEDLYIDIETPLDSLFSPFYTYTTYIQIGENPVTDTLSYKFEKFPLNLPGMLPEVVVRGVAKKNIDLFEEEFTSGLFKFGFATRIDGLSNDNLRNFSNLFDILRTRVPFLIIDQRRPDSISVRWRGAPVSFYIDEFLVPVDNFIINPSEIAMIKAFTPPAYIRPLDPGGVIAIYTKRGKYENSITRRKSIFKIAGYTAGITLWQ